MTAEDYILERIKALKGLDQPAPTRGLDLFERTTIAELENILSLLKTDRMALAKLKGIIVNKEQELSEDTQMPTQDYHITSRAFKWVCERIDELESKREMR